MSIMCCVYVPEGIVMAADSRLTKTKMNQLPVEIPTQAENTKTILCRETVYTTSDNTQKVLLIKKSNVGISFCGTAIINGVTVADFIRKFEIEKVNAGDTTEQIAYKLAEYYTGNDTNFFVCGYDNDIPYVFDVNRKTVKRSNITETRIENELQKDTADDGNEDAVEVGIPKNLKEFPTPTLNVDEHINGEPEVRYGATWAGQVTAITKIVNNQPILNADWGTLPLKDAVDFAEFLVDTTIKYERFCDDIQTCGGDIDILVITKDEAFWKQHKIYNPIKR